jgi:glucose-6-phosphate 1-epimerase
MKISCIEKIRYQNLDALQLQLPDGSKAVVTLAGAHLVSWTSPNGAENLYLSPCSPLEEGQAIRGGVPVIFPQFSTRGPLVRHGFARISKWELLHADGDAGTARVCLGLRGNGAQAWRWPHDYACELTVSLTSDALAIQLAVRNEGTQTFAFTAALHTYLRVHSIEQVRLTGLQHCAYEDSNAAGALQTDTEAFVAPKGPLDRIYRQTPASLQLATGNGVMSLESEGFYDTVVWNPGQEGNPKIADLPPDAYRQFICVEAAVVETPIELAGGQRWSGTQRLRKV